MILIYLNNIYTVIQSFIRTFLASQNVFTLQKEKERENEIKKI